MSNAIEAPEAEIESVVCVRSLVDGQVQAKLPPDGHEGVCLDFKKCLGPGCSEGQPVFVIDDEPPREVMPDNGLVD